jgi:hypothetical protein
MTDLKDEMNSLLPPQEAPTLMQSPLQFGGGMLLAALLPGTQAIMWSLPDEPAKREPILIDCLEKLMATIGYIPIGYVTVGAVKHQLERDASTDRATDVSNERVLGALRSLLKKENRPAGLDACYDELVRAAAAKLKPGPEPATR